MSSLEELLGEALSLSLYIYIGRERDREMEYSCGILVPELPTDGFLSGGALERGFLTQISDFLKESLSQSSPQRDSSLEELLGENAVLSQSC